MYAYNFAISYTIRGAIRLLQWDVTCRRLVDSALMYHSVLPNGTHCAVFSSAGNETRLTYCTARLNFPNLFPVLIDKGATPQAAPLDFEITYMTNLAFHESNMSKRA
jgi:hypothetical protein